MEKSHHIIRRNVLTQVSLKIESYVRGVRSSLSSLTKEQQVIFECKHRYVSDEASLYQCLVKTVQRVDPDILIGFDVERESLGYLLDRV